MFFGSGWLDLEDIKLICEQIFSFLKRCNCVALVIALQLAKEWLSMVAKQLKQKIIFYYTSRLSFSLARSHHHHHPFFFFFFFARYFPANDSQLSSFFKFGICLDCFFFLSYAFAFSWNMVCPVHCSWDLQVHFSQKIILKIGLMVLFIHLKIILLHLKMVCIRLQIKKSVYFIIQLIFATIYGSYCIFCYYLYVLLYYFN